MTEQVVHQEAGESILVAQEEVHGTTGEVQAVVGGEIEAGVDPGDEVGMINGTPVVGHNQRKMIMVVTMMVILTWSLDQKDCKIDSRFPYI